MNIPFLSKKTNCSHQTKEGKQCNATPQAGKAYCFFHDPELAEERAAARRQGGLTSIGKAAPIVPPNLPLVSLKTLDDVSQFFEQITNYVLQGQMDVHTANCVRSLANGVLRTLQAIERSQREALKATLPGKGVPASLPKPFATASSASRHKLETGNSKPETVVQTLPGKGVPASPPKPFATASSVSSHKLETGNPKSETVVHTLPGKAAFSNPAEPGNPAFRKECDSVFLGPDAAKNENPEERKKIDEERHPTAQQVTPHEIGQTHRTGIPSGDMARKKFDEQELAIRKETAHALAPTTMKYSTFHEQGFVVAKEPDTPPELSPEPPVPVRDPDNEPSPISGLLNRHLNYLKFAGMPVSELQRRGLIPSRWKSKFVRRW